MSETTEFEISQDAPPEGFTQLAARMPFEMHAGPFYEREALNGAWHLGFRVTAAKLNKMGVCHGGVLATFADLQGSALKKELKLKLKSPTVNLSLDYVAPAREGAWVHSEPQLVRQTGALLFFQTVIYADGAPCVRASGIYRLLRNKP